MKTLLKNNIIAVFALLLSIGTMSFKLAEKSAKSANESWYYRLDTTAGQTDPNNFERAGAHDECPGTSNVWCVITAPELGSSNLPDLDNIEAIVFKP